MKILVLGSGAREHSIVLALLREKAGHQITVAPGNIGIAVSRSTTSTINTVDIDPNDPLVVADFAVANKIELVIVGPEAPLMAGVSDELRARGIPVFGPSKLAAQLESSKSFAKKIMNAAGVPTGRAEVVETLDAVNNAFDDFGAPYVVKADGLAAGKGVLVTNDRDQALVHATRYLQQGPIVVEEFLDGPEVSLFLLSDGTNVLPLSPAQDYKRLREYHSGPNTGGMGAYSPLAWLSHAHNGRTGVFGSEQAFIDEVIETIAQPVIWQLAADGTPFVGLLYAGLIISPRGLRVIEFNARFGDPETQVILPRLLDPLAQLLYATATGNLKDLPRPKFSSDVAVDVVLASEGYPDAPVVGRQITGIPEAAAIPGVAVLHAGVGNGPDSELISTGGRVLNVVATAKTFSEARKNAYTAITAIQLAGGQFRADIAEHVAFDG